MSHSHSLGCVSKAAHAVGKHSANSVVPLDPSLPSRRSFLPRLLAGNSDHSGAAAPGYPELTPPQKQQNTGRKEVEKLAEMH